MSFLKENNLKRERFIPIRGRALRVPIYFPSISSIKTNREPFEYFRILKALKQSHFLVSAYDIDKSQQKNEFVSALKSNQIDDDAIILMDSGNYEAFWLRDKSWNINRFNEILKNAICDIAFCFDNHYPPEDISENAELIRNSCVKSQSIIDSSSVIPIVHCKREDLNKTVIELYRKTNFTIISVPERSLGNGLIARAEALVSLRKELNKLDNYIYIHLLGTGNPISLAVFSLAGADSFDGLEWCQTAVNSEGALLYHFQQRELIQDDCVFCKDPNLDYESATLGHNLLFYEKWMRNIQTRIDSNTGFELLQQYCRADFLSAIGQIFS